MSIASKHANVDKLEKEIEELERQQKAAEEAKSERDEGSEIDQGDGSPTERTEARREEKKEVPEGVPGEGVDSTDWKKRFGDLRRHSQKSEEENKQLKKRIEELESKAGSASPPTDPEDIKAWIEKYPQVAAVISSIAENTTTQKFSEIESLKELKEEIAREREETKIRKVHSDFDDIVGSNEFHDWAESQPTPVQKALFEGGAEDVIWGLSLYKDSKRRGADPQEKAAATAIKGQKSSEPSGNTKGRWSESRIKKMSDADFEKHWKEIEEAQRSGKFDYDISGAAR